MDEFVTLKEGVQVRSEKLLDHLRTVVARCKVPSRNVFDGLPKTATWKIQKFMLCERAQCVKWRCLS